MRSRRSFRLARAAGQFGILVGDLGEDVLLLEAGIQAQLASPRLILL
jgi:hypothetical protein